MSTNTFTTPDGEPKEMLRIWLKWYLYNGDVDEHR